MGSASSSRSRAEWLGDDVLLAIFHRLPHYRCFIKCSFVCKRWFSLINSHSDYFHQYYVNNNNHNKPSSHSHPHSLCSCYKNPSCALFLNCMVMDRSLYLKFCDSKRSRGGASSNTITLSRFLLSPEDMVIRSSLEDLLLISHKSNPKLFYIYNLLTKKWVALPEAPLDRQRRGLVRNQSDNNSYRVVLLDVKPNNVHDEYHIVAPIFRG